MFCKVPQMKPSRAEKGMDRIMASTTPGMPQICQSATRMTAISAPMAPRVMAKFRPMPAIMGNSKQRTRNRFRPIRVTISLSR